MKGLTVWIQGRDCTAGGITSGRETMTLCGDGIVELNHPRPDAPALVIEYNLEPKGVEPGQLTVAKPDWLHAIGAAPKPSDDFLACMRDGYAGSHRIVNVVARPVDEQGNPMRGGMFGGHYVKTSDSRFPFTSPIPVHDRFER